MVLFPDPDFPTIPNLLLFFILNFRFFNIQGWFLLYLKFILLNSIDLSKLNSSLFLLKLFLGIGCPVGERAEGRTNGRRSETFHSSSVEQM